MRVLANPNWRLKDIKMAFVAKGAWLRNREENHLSAGNKIEEGTACFFGKHMEQLKHLEETRLPEREE